jgi:hypothetical protein
VTRNLSYDAEEVIYQDHAVCLVRCGGVVVGLLTNMASSGVNVTTISEKFTPSITPDVPGSYPWPLWQT